VSSAHHGLGLGVVMLVMGKFTVALAGKEEKVGVWGDGEEVPF